MLGVYVHLPFCPYLCPYCDFAKWPARATQSARYLQALRAELRATAPEPAGTLYLGGGTPNAYGAGEIAELVEELRAHFSLPSGAEASVELNPELVRPGDFERYRSAGLTRVSIGVQSFEPGEVRVLGRKHAREDVERVVGAARAAGMPSVSIDLMFGVPGQTPASWKRTLDAAVALQPDHVSAYGLTVEEGTPYEAWRRREPAAFLDADAEAELYGLAIDTLEAAGYEHYEISNFARPGHRCAHNANYWENGEYAGLGVGAASYRGGVRSVHVRSLAAYVDAALAGRPIPGDGERLEGDRRVGEAIMLALRTAQGVPLRTFEERYSVDVVARFAEVVRGFEREGLLELQGGRMRLTRRGRFVANDVCGAFVSFE